MKSGGGVSARTAVTECIRAQMAPTPELVPPTPAEESTVQRNSVIRLSTSWRARLGWIAGGLVALAVAIITSGPGLAERVRPRSAGIPSWLGLAVVFGGALVFEAIFLTSMWPAVMRDFVPAGAMMALAVPFGVDLRSLGEPAVLTVWDATGWPKQFAARPCGGSECESCWNCLRLPASGETVWVSRNGDLYCDRCARRRVVPGAES